MTKKTLLLLPLVILLLVLIWLVGGKRITPLLGGAGGGAYQSVTLANGAVYFGKIQSSDEATLTLADVFYLKTVQPPAPSGGNQAATQSQLELVKLGNELHGPTDRMIITRRQILAIQELRADSKVVTAINEYYRSQKGR